MLWTSYGLMLIICVFALKYFWNKRKLYYLSFKMPGPIAFPFIGNAWMFLNSSCEVMNIISTAVERFGSLSRFWLGSRFLIFICSPQHMETVIESEIQDKGAARILLEPVIFVSATSKICWRRLESTSKIVESDCSALQYPSFNSSFDETIKILINKLERKAENETFNIYEYIEAASADIVCNTTFGIQMKLQQNENKNVLQAVNNGMFLVGVKTLEPWYQYKPIMRLSKYYKINKNCTVIIREFVEKIYNKKLKDFNNGNLIKNETQSDEFGIKSVRNFIDECIRLTVHQKCFTENDAINESISMLLAGFETTAVTVSNVILMLAMHPEYQEKVHKEIEDILPGNQMTVTAEIINKLHYTDRFIKETLRLFPTIPIITRITRNEMKIGAYNVPSGTELLLSIFDLHRSKAIWGENAARFDPNNFLPENLREKHSHSFIPFAFGTRNCIGFRYANIVVRLMVASLVRNYLFTTDLTYEGLRLKWSVTLKLENGHFVKVKKRILC